MTPGYGATARGQDMIDDIEGDRSTARQTDSPAGDSRLIGSDSPTGPDARPEGLQDAKNMSATHDRHGLPAVNGGQTPLDAGDPDPLDLTPYEARPDTAKTLTAMQWAFCQNWFVDMDQTAAAKRAGYSSHTARQQATRLMSTPRVAAVIAEMMPSQLGTSRPMLLTAFMRIAGARKATYADQIAALDKVSKAVGLYREPPVQAAQINVHIYPGEEGL